MADDGENQNPAPGSSENVPAMRSPEFLPLSEPLAGYIFTFNNDSMQEAMSKQLFGLPYRYKDSVRAIRPGMPLFLYNSESGQLHGIFESMSFGGLDIDPKAWADTNNVGTSRLPAQVRIRTRKLCRPLPNEVFKPLVKHYSDTEFRVELSMLEAMKIEDVMTIRSITDL